MSGRLISMAWWIIDCKLDALQAELEFVASDTADVEQVIDEPHHLRELPLHRCRALVSIPSRSPLECLMISRALPIGARGLRSSCSKRGQEFVFTPVGVFRGLSRLSRAI